MTVERDDADLTVRAEIDATGTANMVVDGVPRQAQLPTVEDAR